MYDNNGRYPIYMDICQMAERIALSKRTIDVNIVQQRTPRIWKTSEDKKRTLQDMLAEIDGMESLITIGRYGPTPSPLLAARDKASVRLETMMRELGLTLKAQSKLEIIEPVVEQSPLEAFVKNKIEKR